MLIVEFELDIMYTLIVMFKFQIDTMKVMFTYQTLRRERKHIRELIWFLFQIRKNANYLQVFYTNIKHRLTLSSAS